MSYAEIRMRTIHTPATNNNTDLTAMRNTEMLA